MPECQKNQPTFVLCFYSVLGGQHDPVYPIYRSLNNGPYVTLKIVDKTNTWQDNKCKKGDIVKYRIKAINEKGWQSEFSKEVVSSF